MTAIFVEPPVVTGVWTPPVDTTPVDAYSVYYSVPGLSDGALRHTMVEVGPMTHFEVIRQVCGKEARVPAARIRIESIERSMVSNDH